MKYSTIGGLIETKLVNNQMSGISVIRSKQPFAYFFKLDQRSSSCKKRGERYSSFLLKKLNGSYKYFEL